MKKKPEERRNEILDASDILFKTKGYTKTTINDILQTVGIAKGTFYYYFRSKQEVMDALVMRFIHNSVEITKTIASNEKLKPHEKIFQIVMAQSKRDIGKKQIIEQLHDVNNAEMHQKSLTETILWLTPILTKIVKQGIKDGLFKTKYPKEVVEFLLVSSQFLFDEGIFQWQSDEITQKATAFAYIIETVLGAETGSFAYIPKIYEKTQR